MNYENCDVWIDQLILILTVFNALAVIIFGTLVFANEDKRIERPIHIGLLSGLENLFTGSYLNEVGRYWRPYFVFSLVFEVSMIMYLTVTSACQ